MKKSFSPSKGSRESSPKPASRPAGGGSRRESGPRPAAGVGRQRESFNPSGQGSGKENLTGRPFMPREGGQRRGRSSLLLTLLGIFLCCLALACIAVVVLVSQGLLSLPSFG